MNSSLTSDLLAEIPNPAELARVMSWLDDLSHIAVAKPRKPVVDLICARRNCSVSTVYNMLRGVRDHGPAFLIDGRSSRTSAPDLYGHRSPAFIQWVHSLYYNNARSQSTPTVWGQMMARLAAWRREPWNPDYRIPGYDTPPLDDPKVRYRHPHGWSQRQLNAIKPDAYKAALGGKGRHAANLLLPPVLTTRIGTHPGEYYMFDDNVYDLKVHYGNDLVRPVGLNVIDLCSGCDVMRGIRPELKDNPEGEKTLTRRDTLWLLINLLTFEGYYRPGAYGIFESGTSTIDEETRRMVSLATDGRFKIDIGEVSREIVRGVLTPSKGNPKFKALRESWFNLLRNRSASLPLALGRNRDEKPEDTDRIVAEEKHLLAIAQSLPIEIRDQLGFEGMPWSRFVPVINHISETINLRTDHQIEGFSAMGHERTEFRLGDQWISEAEYMEQPPEIRALIVSRMHQGEVVSRVTKASPREVYEIGRIDMEKVSPFRWHHLIPARYAVARTIPANRQVVLRSKDYGPEPIHFQATYFLEDRTERPLPAGKDVLIFCNPMRPDFALFTDTSGRPLGLVLAIQKGHRKDFDALHDQWGQRAFLKAELGGSAEVHNQSLADERQERRDTNVAILADHGVSPKKLAKIAGPKRDKKPLQKRPAKSPRIPLSKSPSHPLLPASEPAPEPTPKPRGLGLFN